MNAHFSTLEPSSAPRVWEVGALTRAVADALEARFNPVAVRGEVSGFARATSGHCYFTLKDSAGQLRCAMFRRAASLLDFVPREGDQVELRGRLSVYEARGDLQLVVESMRRAGQGELFEQFLRLKARLEAEGLFDPARKRALPAMPRGIGIVTSLGAAALHDVLTTLVRRVPHIPLLVAPAAVQGADAPAELVAALERLYPLARTPAVGLAPLDLILLVRGGGSIEDLWAFNDEQLARTLAASPVPVISGVGHETDFTIADFVADLRAPTPTAAAELASAPRAQWLDILAEREQRLQRALRRRLDDEAQRVDRLAARLGRPSGVLAAEQVRLARAAERVQHAARWRLQQEQARLDRLAERLPRAPAPQLQAARLGLQRLAERLPAAARGRLESARERVERAALRLDLLDPRLVLERGYAWLEDAQGQPLTRAAQARVGAALTATLADGKVDLSVRGRHLR
ncbi:MAG TPA: exodeoxyribonuclease VII large subunit [Ottowia sp.]|uniref:exodeoxyribonuclease VII large subunit n=1 Tax=Ottowia sp. TaxID=1898956 RepID=UPI002BD9ACBE|nr:exodeoxyribonuclease VII large subunit [Ottowia sp.]HMN21051.1 exodeoxyribonuclease VII large subunit [Ottowia sp.]